MNHSASPLSGQEPLEIERKFLIEYPDPAWLEQQPGSRRVEIVQTYLLSDGSGSRRVRSWTESGRTTWFRTCKRMLTDRTRIEQEDQVTEEEYRSLLAEADPARHPIEKVRWCVPWASHTLEIDLYPFWESSSGTRMRSSKFRRNFGSSARLPETRAI